MTDLYSLPSAQITPLDQGIATYEDLIERFEEAPISKEKGQLLNQCDVHHQQLISMITQDTLISRRKRISALKVRFEKIERALLKEFDIEQLLDVAKRVKTLIQTTHQAQQHQQELVEQGDRLQFLLHRFKIKYNSDPDIKVNKIVADTTILSQQFEELKITNFEQRPASAYRQSIHIQEMIPAPLVQQEDQQNPPQQKKKILCISQSAGDLLPHEQQGSWPKFKLFLIEIFSPCQNSEEEQVEYLEDQGKQA